MNSDGDTKVLGGICLFLRKTYGMKYTVNVIYEKDKHGYYVFRPQLEGCQSQGDTFEEARATIQEAIELFLETLSPNEITARLSHEVVTSSLEIAVA
jgi:predicted RNase H-like HicB family nuclease